MLPNTDNFSISCQAINRIVSRLKPQKSTQMKSCIAGLFLAQNNQMFRFTNMIGLLQLDTDRNLKTKCLRMYNLETLKLVFEIQLYYDFANTYKQKDQKFYYFDYPVGTIGLLFRSKQDANIMAIKIRQNSPKIQQLTQIRKQKQQKYKKQQSSKGFFGYLKKQIFGKQQQIKQQSQILNFEIQSKITIDANGNTIMVGHSPVQKDLQQRLGLSQKQKNDPQIQNLIMQNLIIHNIKKQATQTANKQLMNVIKQYQKQQHEYEQQCRKSMMHNLPPPPPLPSIFFNNNSNNNLNTSNSSLSSSNTSLAPPNMNNLPRTSINDKRMNLMQQIRKAREGGLKLNKVKTIQKGGLEVNLNLQKMDTVERDDFAAALRRKIMLRNKAFNMGKEDSDDD